MQHTLRHRRRYIAPSTPMSDTQFLQAAHTIQYYGYFIDTHYERRHLRRSICCPEIGLDRSDSPLRTNGNDTESERSTKSLGPIPSPEWDILIDSHRHPARSRCDLSDILRESALRPKKPLSGNSQRSFEQCPPSQHVTSTVVDNFDRNVPWKEKPSLSISRSHGEVEPSKGRAKRLWQTLSSIDEEPEPSVAEESNTMVVST